MNRLDWVTVVTTGRVGLLVEVNPTDTPFVWEYVVQYGSAGPYNIYRERDLRLATKAEAEQAEGRN
jgi:hypothetical protein